MDYVNNCIFKRRHINKDKNQIKVGKVTFEKIVEGFLKIKPPKKKQRKQNTKKSK